MAAALVLQRDGRVDLPAEATSVSVGFSWTGATPTSGRKAPDLTGFIYHKYGELLEATNPRIINDDRPYLYLSTNGTPDHVALRIDLASPKLKDASVVHVALLAISTNAELGTTQPDSIECRIFGVQGADTFATLPVAKEVYNDWSCIDAVAIYRREGGWGIQAITRGRVLGNPVPVINDVNREFFPFNWAECVSTGAWREHPSNGENTNLKDTRFVVGLGWVWERMRPKLDLDLAIVMTDWDGNIVDAVNHAHPVSEDGAVRHSGDARRGSSAFSYGAGKGDDERVYVDTSLLSNYVAQMWVVVSAAEGVICDPAKIHLRVIEGADGEGEERVRYDFVKCPPICEGILVCNIRKNLVCMFPAGWGVQHWGFNITDSRSFMAAAPVVDDEGLGVSKHMPKPTYTIEPSAPHVGPEPAREPPAEGRPADPPAPAAIDVTTRGELFMRVHRATIVRAGDVVTKGGKVASASSDPYVKIKLAGKSKSIKTRVIDKSLKPVWEQDLEFPGPFAADDVLEFECIDKDMIGGDLLGTARLPVADIYRLRGPILLKLGGIVLKDKEAYGHLIISFCWTEPPVLTPNERILKD